MGNAPPILAATYRPLCYQLCHRLRESRHKLFPNSMLTKCMFTGPATGKARRYVKFKAGWQVSVWKTTEDCTRSCSLHMGLCLTFGPEITDALLLRSCSLVSDIDEWMCLARCQGNRPYFWNTDIMFLLFVKIFSTICILQNRHLCKFFDIVNSNKWTRSVDQHYCLFPLRPYISFHLWSSLQCTDINS